MHIFQRGTKHTLAVEVKIALYRQKFQSSCSLFSSNFSKLDLDHYDVFTHTHIPLWSKYHSFGILSLLGTFPYLFWKEVESTMYVSWGEKSSLLLLKHLMSCTLTTRLCWDLSNRCQVQICSLLKYICISVVSI